MQEKGLPKRVSCLKIKSCRKCKQHFITTIMKDMRREIRNLYRGADRAYAALDFTGVGEITEKDFLDSIIC